MLQELSLSSKKDLLEVGISQIVFVLLLKQLTLLDYKVFGGNVALKLDVKKAFDTIDWYFLLRVLKAFGFNSTFCSWIQPVLNSAKLSINRN